MAGWPLCGQSAPERRSVAASPPAPPATTGSDSDGACPLASPVGAQSSQCSSTTTGSRARSWREDAEPGHAEGRAPRLPRQQRSPRPQPSRTLTATVCDPEHPAYPA